MKNVLIVEDKDTHRKTLSVLLRNLRCNIQIYEAGNIEEAYSIAMENNINLFLIDIILDVEGFGDVSGLRFAENIRNVSKYSFTPLIFITSLEDPQLYAYREIHCFGYIEKPFEPLEVERLVRKALEFPEVKDEDTNIYFRKEGIVYSVKRKDIIYIEVSKRKLVIHTTKEELTMSYKSCEQLLRELASDDFLQCSRYVIINKNFVQSVDYINRYIKLHGVERVVEIGTSMKKRVKNEFGD